MMIETPFFTAAHRELARDLGTWCARELADVHALEDRVGVDETCRELVRRLGVSGWLRHTVPAVAGGASEQLDVRSLCIARETLARAAGLADFAFAMQGLGAGPISLFGSDALKQRYLPGVRDGTRVAAFALSEPEAGSDVTAMQTSARRLGDEWVLDGTKTWISNAGIASFYVVFARMPDEGDDGRAFGAFVVDADAPGFVVAERIAASAPHPLGTVVLRHCRVPLDAIVGAPGKGMRVALGTLDVFRSTVAAAALGFARRALDEALAWVTQRKAFGQRLAEFQLTQARLAEMATSIDASALLVARAAWTRDCVAPRVTREAAMAKLFATEHAQRVIDDAVQLLGGRGVVAGSTVERLYREIRALRIYEGTTEIQKLVIARDLLESRGEHA